MTTSSCSATSTAWSSHPANTTSALFLGKAFVACMPLDKVVGISKIRARGGKTERKAPADAGDHDLANPRQPHRGRA